MAVTFSAQVRRANDARTYCDRCGTAAHHDLGLAAASADAPAWWSTMTALVLSFTIALVATPAVRWWLGRRGVLDVPNVRSSHENPTPRGGGIAVALATSIGALTGDATTTGAVLVVSSLALGAVGLIDDLRSLPPAPRLVAQLVLPAGALAWVTWTEIDDRALAAALLAGGLLWTVAYVNAFNFMDGINAISAVQAATAGGTIAWAAAAQDVDDLVAPGLAVVGAALGFAVYNASGSIFLGDVGSYFLGCWLSVLAVAAVASGISVPVVAAPFLLYVLDTGATLIRRHQRGEHLTTAHKDHAYQRLHRAGWSHVRVAAVVGVVTGFGGLVGVALVDAPVAVRAVWGAVALATAVGFVMLPDRLEAS